MSTKIKYIPMYKCRFCKTIHTSGSKYQLPEVVVDTLTEVQHLPTILYETHKAQYFAEEPHIGISDLIGFSKVEVDEKEEKDANT